MDWADPTTSVVQSLDGAVLAALAQTNEGLTGREVHRRARRGSVAGVSEVLYRLAEQGVVDVVPAGASKLYTLNRDHVAAGVAVALAGLRAEFFNRLRDELRTWQPPAQAAAVFGSVARGEASTASDVDILILRPPGAAEDDPDWDAQTDRLREAVTRWCGNEASILAVTEEDLHDLVARQAPVRESLLNDAIDVGAHPVGDYLQRSAV